MKIGIDASRAVLGQRAAGYTREFLGALARISSEQDEFLLFTPKPLEMDFPDNFKVIVGGPKRLWTHLYLAKACKKHGAQVLFVYHHVLPFNLKIPAVTTIHDMASVIYPEFYPIKERFYQDLGYRLAIAKAQKIIAVSETTKHDFLNIYEVEEAKVKTVYNGFTRSFSADGAEVLEVRQKFELPKPYFLFVGKQEPRKNLCNLVLALQILKKDFGLNYDIVMAGSFGSATDEIIKLAKSASLKNEIKLIGRVSQTDLVGLYRGAAAAIVPSWYEGFGFPVLEAFSCKTPVIASKIPALAEIALDAASFANPESPTTLAKAMFNVATNPDLRNDLIQKGLRRMQDFSWEKCALETLRIIKEVTKESKT